METDDGEVIHIRHVKPQRQRVDETQYDPMDFDSSDEDSSYEEEGEFEFEVNRIIGHRQGNNGPEYLVDWMPTRRSYEPTWEPLEHLDNALEALHEYQRENQ